MRGPRNADEDHVSPITVDSSPRDSLKKIYIPEQGFNFVFFLEEE